MEAFGSVASKLDDIVSSFHIGPSPPLALVVNSDVGVTEVRQLSIFEVIKLQQGVAAEEVRPWLRFLTPRGLHDGRARFMFLLTSVLGQCALPSSPFATAHRLVFFRAVASAQPLLLACVARAAARQESAAKPLLQHGAGDGEGDGKADVKIILQLLTTVLSTHLSPVVAHRLAAAMIAYAELRGPLGAVAEPWRELADISKRSTRIALVSGDPTQTCVVQDTLVLHVQQRSNGRASHLVRVDGFMALVDCERSSTYEGYTWDDDSSSSTSSSTSDQDDVAVEGELSKEEANRRVVESAHRVMELAAAAGVNVMLVAAVLPKIYFQLAGTSITIVDGLGRRQLDDVAWRSHGRTTTIGFGLVEPFQPIRYRQADVGKEVVTVSCGDGVIGPTLILKGPHRVVRMRLLDEVRRAAGVVRDSIENDGSSRSSSSCRCLAVRSGRGSFRKVLESELRLEASRSAPTTRFVLDAFADGVFRLDRHMRACAGPSAAADAVDDDEGGGLDAVATWEDIVRAAASALASMARIDRLVAAASTKGSKEIIAQRLPRELK